MLKRKLPDSMRDSPARRLIISQQVPTRLLICDTTAAGWARRVALVQFDQLREARHGVQRPCAAHGSSGDEVALARFDASGRLAGGRLPPAADAR